MLRLQHTFGSLRIACSALPRDSFHILSIFLFTLNLAVRAAWHRPASIKHTPSCYCKMKRSTTNVLCIPRYFMHHVTWSRLGMASNFSGHILVLKRNNYHWILPPDPNERCPKFFQQRKILSNISNTIKHIKKCTAVWNSHDNACNYSTMTREWR